MACSLSKAVLPAMVLPPAQGLAHLSSLSPCGKEGVALLTLKAENVTFFVFSVLVMLVSIAGIRAGLELAERVRLLWDCPGR